MIISAEMPSPTAVPVAAYAGVNIATEPAAIASGFSILLIGKSPWFWSLQCPVNTRSLAAPLLGRFAPRTGLVTLRQTFVRRCQKALRGLYREQAMARARAAATRQHRCSDRMHNTAALGGKPENICSF